MPTVQPKRQILVVSDFPDTGWRWVADKMDPNLHWRFVGNGPRVPGVLGKMRRIVRILWAMRHARSSAIIMSHGPLSAFLVEIGRRIVAAHTPHITYAFNYARLPTGFDLARLRWAFRGIERFVVSSHMEMPLYAGLFDIPQDRFDPVLWGTDVPLPAERHPAGGAYLCAIGGNARDYPLLMAAAALTPHIKYECVVRPDNLEGLSIPPNVRAHVNLPLGETMALLRDARAMVLPLLNAETPCGHVTLVAAHQLGTAIIATASAGISDYVDNDRTGLVVPPGNPRALATAVTRIMSDDALRMRLAHAGQRFAELHCTERNMIAHLTGELNRLGLLG